MYVKSGPKLNPQPANQNTSVLVFSVAVNTTY